MSQQLTATYQRILNKLGFSKVPEDVEERRNALKYFGLLVHDYLEESVHSDWEGYEPSEVEAIQEFFTDMERYLEGLGLELFETVQ